MTAQDAIAIVVAVAAGLWLLRLAAARLLAPPCQPPADRGPAGNDGFVPLERLRRRDS